MMKNIFRMKKGEIKKKNEMKEQKGQKQKAMI